VYAIIERACSGKVVIVISLRLLWVPNIAARVLENARSAPPITGSKQHPYRPSANLDAGAGMNIRKHLAAKLIVVATTLASMLGVWTVVRNDPPPATDAAADPIVAATPATQRSTASKAAPAPATQRQTTPQRHTRTRAS
jgi:hypothetical protein